MQSIQKRMMCLYRNWNHNFSIFFIVFSPIKKRCCIPLRFFSINPIPFSESSSFTIFTHVGLEHPKSSIIFSIEYTIYALFYSSNQPFLIERYILSSIRPYNSFASLYNFLNLLSLIRSLGIRSKENCSDSIP